MEVDNGGSQNLSQRPALKAIDQNASLGGGMRQAVKNQTDREKWKRVIRPDQEKVSSCSENEKENIRVGTKRGTQVWEPENAELCELESRKKVKGQIGEHGQISPQVGVASQKWPQSDQ